MNIVQDIEDELDAIADASASMVYHEIKNFHLLGKARAEIIRLRTAVALIGECADEFKLENERLREALRVIADGDAPRDHAIIYRSDGVHSKHDKCRHGAWMYDGCEDCVTEYARAALGRESE